MFKSTKSTGHGRYWLEADDRELLRLRTLGKSLREIGRLMGRTRMAVHGRCQSLGIDYTPPQQVIDERERRIELVTSPHTVQKVARILGITTRAVNQMKVRLRRQGVKVLSCSSYRAKGVFRGDRQARWPKTTGLAM
jgi:DNA-binding CsgD family transcriptional regulator